MWTLVPIILICAIEVPAKDCTEAVALIRMVAPASEDGTGFAGCLRVGMLYAASSHLVTAGTYPKIFCAPPDRIAGKPDDWQLSSYPSVLPSLQRDEETVHR
jgi:hypothetical protein